VFEQSSKRRDDGGTAITNWLREQKELRPVDGIRSYDIDLSWWKKSPYEPGFRGEGDFMFLEFKEYEYYPKHDQALHLKTLDKYMKASPPAQPFWKGVHLIRFQKTTPVDGLTFLDDKVVSRDFFIKEFLTFTAPDQWYISWFDKLLAKDHDWKEYLR